MKKSNNVEYAIDKMRQCQHIFIKSTWDSYEDTTTDNKEHETIDYSKCSHYTEYYCLKCGCTTTDICHRIKNVLGLSGTFIDIVPYKEQLSIAQEALTKTNTPNLIDCSEVGLFGAIMTWKSICRENPDLQFDELVSIFTEEINVKREVIIAKQWKIRKIKHRVIEKGTHF